MMGKLALLSPLQGAKQTPTQARPRPPPRYQAQPGNALPRRLRRHELQALHTKGNFAFLHVH
jgi:hypothetical protein